MTEKNDNITHNAKKDRSDLLDTSSWLVDILHDRLSKSRFVVYDSDAVKLSYYRVLLQALQTHNQILKDDDIEGIKSRLDLIEAVMEAEK